MRFSISSTVTTLSALLTFSPFTSAAVNMIESQSLNPCQDNSSFTATLFNVVFTPENQTLAFNVVGVSSIQGNVTAQLLVIAYGFTAVNLTLDPCTMNLGGLCPLSTGNINIQSNIEVSPEVISKIPKIAYYVPDLDGVVRIYIRNSTGASVACVEAELSNGKTVDQKAVGWATAVVAGIGLIASAVTSGLGHSNTAAHVAANALSLFGFFQAQAIIGMTAVLMPPIVESWTQNFQWTMGIIHIGFLQSICTWYLRATGGTPTTYLSTLATVSVAVQKRSLDVVQRIIRKGVQHIGKRTNSSSAVAETKVIVVSGIDRVGFRAGIEQTNIFLTGLIFFIVFCFVVAVAVTLFKFFCEMATKAQWMKQERFAEFRHGWKVVLKGILVRLVLIGYSQMCVLCLWELVQRNSSAEAVLAIFVFLSMSFVLAWAGQKVIRLARRSVNMHKNPAYILYSDPKCLNKWGFLYVQYRATAYYFVVPTLVYVLIKGVFIAFAQGSPTAQAIGLVIIEAVFLIGVSVFRPWMDKKTNVFNISIASVNFLNAVFLLIFTSVFGQPVFVTGIMGVLFVIYNVVFALILLILVLIASVYAIASKNPDNRYQPMRDDRGSFIKSQSQLNTELDALGATARGDLKTPYDKGGLEDESSSSSSLNHAQVDASGSPLPPSTANSGHHHGMADRRSLIPDQPMFPSDNPGRRGPAPKYEAERGMDSQNHNGSDQNYSSSRPNTAPPRQPSTEYGNGSAFQRTGTSHSYQGQFRPQNDRSPWQRGAGYDV